MWTASTPDVVRTTVQRKGNPNHGFQADQGSHLCDDHVTMKWEFKHNYKISLSTPGYTVHRQCIAKLLFWLDDVGTMFIRNIRIIWKKEKKKKDFL